MQLPRDFHFSQYNLQDYVDCPRRFELRHLRKLEWPAVQSAPVLEQELRMERGTQFHRLVQQWAAGIPAEKLEQRISDPYLRDWWETFLREQPLQPFPGKVQAEVTLTAPFMGYRLLAKMDILITKPGKAFTIFDWKTSDKRPRSAVLRAKVQSRLYPMMAVLAGAQLNQRQPWLAEQVSMHYWFVQHPADPEVIEYNDTRYHSDHSHLEGLVEEILWNAQDDTFQMTKDIQQCKFCPYRSFCERGIEAGDLAEMEAAQELSIDESILNLDLEQIGEIAF